ncbi:MAG TPA: M50 family metallopeptidase [Terriglobales bacterium]|jgi:hypothetical protein|nr:M50 family metallopeptidase [Terriglobales bacterium]
MATSATNPTTTATPILDCVQTLPKRKRWKRWVGWTIWIAVILTLPWSGELTQHSTYWGAMLHVVDLTAKTFFGTMLPPAGASAIFGLLLVWLALYCALIIHELGHIVAGLTVRFQANFLIIYPFRFTRTRTGWAVRRERLASVSGAASMLPQSFEHLRPRLMIYVLGGPAANLLTFMLLRAWLPNMAQAPDQTILFLDSLANLSLFLGAANLLPFQARGFQSDGARVLMAAAKERKFLRWYALVRLSTSIAGGIRARDLDPAVIQQALELNDSSGDWLRANLIAYSWAADREDVAVAAASLEKCLAYAGKLPNKTRCFLMLEAAVFQGWYREDAGRAAHWMNLAGAARKRLPALYRLRPEIAVAWADGHSAEAETKLQEAIAEVRKMPANAARDRLETSMTEWQQKMQLRLQARQTNSAASSY